MSDRCNSIAAAPLIVDTAPLNLHLLATRGKEAGQLWRPQAAPFQAGPRPQRCPAAPIGRSVRG